MIPKGSNSSCRTLTGTDWKLPVVVMIEEAQPVILRKRDMPSHYRLKS